MAAVAEGAAGVKIRQHVASGVGLAAVSVAVPAGDSSQSCSPSCSPSCSSLCVCSSTGAAWRRRRAAFFRSASDRKAEEGDGSPAAVRVDYMLWCGERAAERLARLRACEEDPGRSESQATRNSFAALQRVLGCAAERRALCAFLARGQTVNLWYCWLALERFRAEEGEECAGGETAQARTSRRKARLLFETFCQEQSALFVPAGAETRATLDRVVWSTPEHIDVGRRVFNAMQSKVLLELERALLGPFLRSDAYRGVSARECVAVIPHATLGEVLASDEARALLVAHLGGACESMDDAGGVPGGVLAEPRVAASGAGCSALGGSGAGSSEPPHVQLVKFLHALRLLEREPSEQERRRRGLSLLSVIVEQGSSALRHVLAAPGAGDVEALRRALLQGGEDGDMGAFVPLAERAFFELRDRHFAAFMRSQHYLTCLSLLRGAAVEDLLVALRRLGRGRGRAAAAAPPPDARARKQQAQAEQGGPPESPAAALLRLALRVGRPSSATSIGRVGLAPAPSVQEMDSEARIKPPPREWRHAHREPGLDRAGCSGGAADQPAMDRSEDTVRRAAASSKPARTGRRLALGLEGVLQHDELALAFAAFCATHCLDGDGAEQLVALLDALDEPPPRHGLRNLASSTPLRRLLPAKALQAALSQDATAADLAALRASAANVLLARFFAPFQAVRKLELAFPGLFSTCFE